MTVNVISLSGGKDSTALALLAIERDVENLRFVFCNTGNEAQETLEYIAYLEQILHSKTGRNIEVCEVSFREMGFARVGCFPCINCRKAELRLIADQFPEHIRRIKVWESIVSDASKRGKSTFFPIESGRDGILDWVEWAKTDRGGKQFMLDLEETTTCKSVYGLCE